MVTIAIVFGPAGDLGDLARGMDERSRGTGLLPRAKGGLVPDDAGAEGHVLRGFSFHALLEEIVRNRGVAIFGEDRLVVDFDHAEVESRREAHVDPAAEF